MQRVAHCVSDSRARNNVIRVLLLDYIKIHDDETTLVIHIVHN